MNLRRIETFVAYWTLFLLLIYVPAETWISLPGGLLNPFYLVDVVAMVLMLWGAVRSLRARPTPAPALMCTGFAWASANAWRATAWRLQELDAGGSLSHGLAEVWAIGIGAVICLVTFGVLLVLVAGHTSAP